MIAISFYYSIYQLDRSLTEQGLAKDWEVSLEEAQQTLDLWFADRPEVLEWQRKTITTARKTGYTRTLMGRYRRLPDINSEKF